MPVTKIRGVDIVHETLRDHGTWVTVAPGGRRGLATLIAEAGFRVVIHDRRDIGASGLAIDGDVESLEQAEDLFAQPRTLTIGPAYATGP